MTLLSQLQLFIRDSTALSAIENIAKYLPRAARDGSDLEAREHVA